MLAEYPFMSMVTNSTNTEMKFGSTPPKSAQLQIAANALTMLDDNQGLESYVSLSVRQLRLFTNFSAFHDHFQLT
jgi:hypothetical protein